MTNTLEKYIEKQMRVDKEEFQQLFRLCSVYESYRSCEPLYSLDGCTRVRETF